MQPHTAEVSPPNNKHSESDHNTLRWDDLIFSGRDEAVEATPVQAPSWHPVSRRGCFTQGKQKQQRLSGCATSVLKRLDAIGALFYDQFRYGVRIFLEHRFHFLAISRRKTSCKTCSFKTYFLILGEGASIMPFLWQSVSLRIQFGTFRVLNFDSGF